MSTLDVKAQVAQYAEDSALRQSWRTATGFSFDKERYLDSFGRRRYLKTLSIIVEMRIDNAYHAQVNGELEGVITPFWTPVPGLCADLVISPTALNRLLKEYNGLTAQHMCDRHLCFRLDLDRKIAAEIATFIRSKFVPGANEKLDCELDLQTQYLEFWRAWREHRKSTPGWNNATWAAQHGFSSYTRFHRAFTVAFGKSPIQYEAQTMHEAALYFRAAHSLARRFHAGGTYPTDANSYDHYVQLRSENEIWWSRQHERYGLNLELRDLAKELNKGAAEFNPEVLEDPFTVCTRETKIAESNPLPATPVNNPWPDAETGGPARLYPIGPGERSEQEASPTTSPTGETAHSPLTSHNEEASQTKLRVPIHATSRELLLAPSAPGPN